MTARRALSLVISLLLLQDARETYAESGGPSVASSVEPPAAARSIVSTVPSDAVLREFRLRADKLIQPLLRQGLSVGVRVIALPSGQVLYSVNAEGIAPLAAAGSQPGLQLLSPASNLKLLTTAAALDQLSPQHRFRTVLGRRGADLVVLGDGDPSFGDPDVEGGVSTEAILAGWADAVKAMGLTRVDSVIIDDSVFDGEFTAPGWPAEQLAEWFCAPVGGLNANTNCAEVRVTAAAGGGSASLRISPANDWLRVINQLRPGSSNVVGLSHGSAVEEIVVRGSFARGSTAYAITVRDPGLFVGHCFVRALADRGIPVTAGVRRGVVRHDDGRVPSDFATLAVHETPLPAVLTRCNKRSQNLYAECLFKTLGRVRSGGPDTPTATGTWASGRAAMFRFLDKLHLPGDAAAVQILDGSGLSRDNAVSPMVVTEVLRHAYVQPHFTVFRNSLAVGGVDGTLAKRLTAAELRGRVLGKTGFIRGVSGLSGYVRPPENGESPWLAFSMLTNGVRGSTLPVKAVEDELCREMVRLLDQLCAGVRPAGGPRP